MKPKLFADKQERGAEKVSIIIPAPVTEKRITILDIELALAAFFNIRQNLIVPNVSWALGLHECDMLILTKAGYAWEVEIKTSLADLKNDRKKSHGHYHKKIRRLYFAIPNYLLEKGLEFIPERAGVLTVDEMRRIKNIRAATVFTGAIKLPDKDKEHLYHLCAMRIWNLKKIIAIQKKEEPKP